MVNVGGEWVTEEGGAGAVERRLLSKLVAAQDISTQSSWSQAATLATMILTQFLSRGKGSPRSRQKFAVLRSCAAYRYLRIRRPT